MKLTNGNFKLSKTSKRMLAIIGDKAQRAVVRRMMVVAEVAASIKPKSVKTGERPA